uniref:E3 ubiquitin/ISG15 ligase TRIM25-like n=1 Tax=Hippocampus comes TaxID=109280 RepID=A0A3Q2YPY3_HIPCM
MACVCNYVCNFSMREELSCPICLQLYLDPVVLPCGHNYCQVCIMQTIDNADKTLQCPECRLEFQGVQSLQKNFKLSSIINGYIASTSTLDTKVENQPKADELYEYPVVAESQTGKECDIHHCPLVYFCSTDMALHTETPSIFSKVDSAPYNPMPLVSNFPPILSRFVLIEEKVRKAATVSISCNIPTKAPLNTKQMQEGLRSEAFRAEISRLAEFLCILFNPLELTFNSCTAHPNLQLSNDLRTAKYSDTRQPHVEHKERFTSAPQVMCNQGFSSGEHVWVVEVGPESMWSLGVCYKTIPRRGDHSRLGHNSVSWRLQWKNGKLTVCKSSSNVVLREMKQQPLKIEVALDYEGGTLMFHNIKGQREHLYTFKVAFKDTVYPAFSIQSNTPGSWITLQCGL